MLAKILFLLMYTSGLTQCAKIPQSESNNSDGQTLPLNMIHDFNEVDFDTALFPNKNQSTSLSSSSSSNLTLPRSALPSDPYITEIQGAIIEFSSFREPWIHFHKAEKAVISCFAHLSYVVCFHPLYGKV